MHSSACDLEPPRLGGAEVFVAIAALVTEGRAPNKNKVADVKTHVFSEGPHCTFSKASQGHVCNLDNTLCIKYDKISSYVLSLWQKSLPLCIDVLLVPKCCCETDLVCNPSTSLELIGSAILLEQWNINVSHKRTHDFSTNLNINQLINAIRSQLYFSQISAWLATPDEKIRQNFQNNTSVIYSLTVPGETYGCTKFATNSQHHNFPTADLGNGYILKVSLSNLPRTEEIPHIKCSKCDVPVQQQQPSSSPTQNTTANVMETHISVLDDRMQTSCTLKGKHRCDDFDELDNCCNQSPRFKKHSRVKNFLNLDTTTTTNGECLPSTSRNLADIQGTSKSKLQLNFHADSDNKTCDNGYENLSQQDASKKDLGLSRKEFVEVLSVLRGKSKTQNTKKDLEKQSKGDILLDAILRSSKLMDMKNNSDAPATTTVAFHTKRSVVDSTSDKVEETNILPLGTTNCLDRNKRQCMMHNKSGITSLPCDDNAASVKHSMRDGDNTCDKNDSIIISDNKIRNSNNQHNIYVDINCDNVKRKKSDYIKMCDISNVFSLEYLEKRQKVKVKQKITFDDDDNNDERTSYTKCNSNKTKELCLSENNHKTNESIENNNEENVVKEINQTVGIPSALEQAKFRKSLDSAASMVFHSRTGLPLTSSPAPVRRGKSCFDFDSSINSVSAIRSALFSLAHCSADEDSESDCSIVSPCSPDATNGLKQRDIPPIKYKHRGQSSGLLGNFEESVLNGRLEPVSTVHGFSAELGASGSFCPRHVVLPVTVFFYTLGDNDKVSTPYLGHINLGKKGYNVPKTGTIQVTLFNPLGTVVKMFVIMYDLSDMPPNSQTFIRQRTLFMPANCEDKNLEWSQKWLRYLIHLRFMSSKSGRIFLHSDIRMIICRKSDLDTATAHGIDMSYELRSFTHSPANPKFSPRK